MPRVRAFTERPDVSTDEEEEMEEEEQSDIDSEDEIAPSSPTKGKGKGKEIEKGSNIIEKTAFDAYFDYNKPGRVQTSSNVYSQAVLPLSAEEYAEALVSSKLLPPIQPAILSEKNKKLLFSRFIFELTEGFNIICYGLGSKRRALNQFATDICSKRGHVVVANGFQPDFSIKDMLSSIEDIPAMQKLDLTSTTPDKQARRIHDFFLEQTVHLYLVIHNIDASPFRASKAKPILALLAHNPHIHIIASIDHINAPLLWSSSEMFARKSDGDTASSRGFAWLWHDLTTLAAYDFELAFVDRASLSGAHTGGARRKADTLAAQNATAMTETAATHILASVTKKAQKLFALVGNKQLEAIEGAEEGGNLQQFGIAYDMLFALARENFLATNDTALGALLTEFKDHSLIVSAQATAAGGEVLWIPMRKERLVNVLKNLEA
ncbi:hypothetical protein D9619_010681 [Psilocybe cf. subviscida]|uniref:Origin recognition complex subunit 2 n=1 Tax=Psilocybe cf. subviscida TaxID=2480587 RepID=A0A8H5B9Q0_9AGAR|nr:hypothetical protein D9619_010681 [Psilocybe cf. subviscida]